MLLTLDSSYITNSPAFELDGKIVKVCQQALKPYMTPYKPHLSKKKSFSGRHNTALEEDSFIINAKSAFTHRSSLIHSILSLDNSKTSSNQELCKSSHNRQRDSFF